MATISSEKNESTSPDFLSSSSASSPALTPDATLHTSDSILHRYLFDIKQSFQEDSTLSWTEGPPSGHGTSISLSDDSTTVVDSSTSWSDSSASWSDSSTSWSDSSASWSDSSISLSDSSVSWLDSTVTWSDSFVTLSPGTITQDAPHTTDYSWNNPIIRYFSIVAILAFVCLCLLIFHVFIWMDEERKSRQESLKNPSHATLGNRRGLGIGLSAKGKGLQTGFMMKVKR